MGQTLLQIGMVSFIGIACIDTLMFKLLNKSNVTNHRLGYQGKLTTVASVIMCCLIVVGIVSTADEYIASLRNGVSAGVYVFTYELLLLLLVCVLELALTNKKTEDLDKVSDIRKGANLLL